MNREMRVLVPMYTVPERKRSLSALNSIDIEKMSEFNLLPLLVSGFMNNAAIDELYRLSYGVLLTGGKDVNPDSYNRPHHPLTKLEEPIREKLEMEITRRTLADKKPFLGICRGAQILAVACGGTLIQHLPEVTEEKHGLSEEESKDSVVPDPEHEVLVTRNTKMHTILKKDHVIVISTHHQAIDNPGELVISGRSPDGITEFVEHPDLPFHIGIQGHPEVNNNLDAVYTAFYEAVLLFTQSRFSNTSMD